MNSIKSFIKKEIVLSVSFVLAALSCIFVKPDILYVDYIDFRTLCILLALMLTMAGFQQQGVFLQIGKNLAGRMHSMRGVSIVLIALCFFSSMFITNDVALLTFVPFSIITLSISGQQKLFIDVIVLETVAANLGSMLTPLGNPQNLYLYSLSGMELTEFIMLMLPYSIAAGILLIIFAVFMVKPEPASIQEAGDFSASKQRNLLIIMYTLTFLMSLLVVIRVLPYQAGLLAVLLPVLLFDREILKKPDYSLLFTFIFLFIFIGNIKRIPFLSELLKELVKLNETGISILLSQFISNVPAAILCSGFTENIPNLIVGTNLGGLGTLIASMASLISFKQYCTTEKPDAKRYLLRFTAVNVIFLIAMVGILYIQKSLSFN